MSRKVITKSDRIAMERYLKDYIKKQAKQITELKAENKRLKEQLQQQLKDSEKRYKTIYQEGLLQKQFDKDMEITELQQQLKEYSELGTPKEIDDTYRSRNILTNNLQEANRIIDDLVKQLHDLPKKIVGEIKNELGTSKLKLRIIGIDGYSYTNSFLDTILKKYGGKNE